MAVYLDGIGLDPVGLTPIGTVHTCFKEKFGIPRQPNLADLAPGVVVFSSEYARPEAVRGLEQFSHIWLIFLFHKAKKSRQWSPMVRPPRLGGNKKVGVFASRSPFRPNPIGMSCVKLEQVEYTAKGPVLHLTGVDILDGTPILDIKPYLPYSDCLAEAEDGFAPAPDTEKCRVSFSDQALAQIREKEKKISDLTTIITQVLGNDPRPAYCGSHRLGDNSGSAQDITKVNGPEQGRVYGIRLFDFDLKWLARGNDIQVLSLNPYEPSSNET